MVALILDFGGPVLRTPFELREAGERRCGLPPGSFAWTGPFDPASDPEWRAFQSGDLTERAYWQAQVDRYAELTGQPAEFPDLMRPIFAGDEDEMIRPEARSLVRGARAAGIPVGILTNDLTAFHDAEWVARVSILDEVDVMVDGRRDGVMKPRREAYELILGRMGVAAADSVFVDDQPVNLKGAADVGMRTVLLDPVDPGPAFAEARRLLGLEAER